MHFYKSAKITVGLAFGKYAVLNSSTILAGCDHGRKRVFLNYFAIFDPMDIKFWIWVGIIVVTFIVRAAKKKQAPESAPKRSPNPDRTRQPVPSGSLEEKPRPMTFEELLEEIQGAKQPKPEPKPFGKPFVSPVVDHRAEAWQEEKKPLEDTAYDYRKHDKIYDIYDKAKEEAFHRPSLEETLKLEDTVMKFGQFKGYQHHHQRNIAMELTREIRTPAGLKKAFVMNEILQRRF
jgi:hypothetical protein